MVFPWEPPITTRFLFFDCSNKYSGYEKIFKPKSWALKSSGLSARACIPKITESICSVILEGNQPIFSGKIPAFSSLDLEGLKIALDNIDEIIKVVDSVYEGKPCAIYNLNNGDTVVEFERFPKLRYKALKNKEKESGCTVHYVNRELDSGDIILQSKVKITKNETKESLENKILKKEHILYPKAINKICRVDPYFIKIGGTIWWQ